MYLASFSTLCGHIKTAEQWTIIQQYGDRYTGRWWVGCHIWYSEEERPGRGRSPPMPLLAVPNVTAHPSTASVPTSYHLMWHYNCLCTLKGKVNQIAKQRPTQYLPMVHFQLPWRDRWGDRHQNARRTVWDRPPPLSKISAKSVQQFWRRCIANSQTNSKLIIPPLPRRGIIRMAHTDMLKKLWGKHWRIVWG